MRTPKATAARKPACRSAVSAMTARNTATRGLSMRSDGRLEPRSAGGGEPRLGNAQAVGRLLAVARRGVDTTRHRATGGIQGGPTTAGQGAAALGAATHAVAELPARVAPRARREEDGQGRA